MANFFVAHNLNVLPQIRDKENIGRQCVALLISSHVVLHLAEIRREGITP